LLQSAAAGRVDWQTLAMKLKKRILVVEDDTALATGLLDNLLSKGVVLSADLVLALANVDLVYVRLSALLCAADRVLPRGR